MTGTLLLLSGADSRRPPARIASPQANRGAAGSPELGRSAALLSRHVRAGGGAASLALVSLVEDVVDMSLPFAAACRDAGIGEVAVIPIGSRAVADGHALHARLDDAAAIAVVAEDPGRLVSRIAGTGLHAHLERHTRIGGVVAGIGRAVDAFGVLMRATSPLELVRDGLGLLPDAVVDSEAADSGRIGELIAIIARRSDVVAFAPEHGASLVRDTTGELRVGGSGGVYVLEAEASASPATRAVMPPRTGSSVRVHRLASGDAYDLDARRPRAYPLRASLTRHGAG